MPSKPIERHILRSILAAGGWEPILERIGSGETVAQIAATFLKPDGQPISRASFSNLLHHDPERSKRVFAARTDGAAAMVDKALDLVDTASVDRDAVNKAKVQAETRLRVAGLIDRPNWGEAKQQVNVQVNVADLHLDALRTRSVLPEMIGTGVRASDLERLAARGRETDENGSQPSTSDSRGDS